MTVFGASTPQTDDDGYNALSFVIWQELKKVQTLTLAQVVADTANDADAAAGFVNVQPLVNQMTGDRLAVPHGVLYRVPYLRSVGGSNAIINDPVPGDIGVVGFCSRDISAVIAAGGQANPGSFRMFDWADGVYLGSLGMFDGTPSQYIAFQAGILLGAAMVRTTGNFAVGTGASGVLTDVTGQVATFQEGICVSIV